ncbi:MAG: 5-amino-6-(D-ribitylamino)uracil--L-tyrosine 4-hydroxyphenyl transferase CofH [Sandaracinaceae bacterium]|nr:5-amino-6-(D-ribitylamino)uracil--L-tyrosine 4-hydroxyphenyl transferase CofH [Sandaracinaceae bacterium]
MTTLASVLLNETRPEVRAILEKSLSGGETSWQEGVVLSAARGRELHALTAVADELRKQQVGDRVSYVVNRNINFTNVCVKTCRFCAFARGIRSEQGYMLPHDEVVARVLQAKAMGATEVCLQAGLAPDLTGDSYVQLTEAVRRAAPDLHIHAFSPEEVLFGSQLAREPVPVFLARLKEAGLGSLPGTSAEILDDELRKRIAPTRISTANWVHVIESAHELGIPTTSTMMFGHVETAEQRMRHLDTLRSIQKRTGGFTEFVPLSFVHAESPLFVKHEVPGVTPGPSGDDVVRLYAIARLMLGAHIPNLQASWVKEGIRTSQWLLHCGVNDLGGTLMNESISTAAGATHGQLMTPAGLRRVIRDAGRVPVQRNTRYDALRVFDGDPALEVPEPLDLVEDASAVFGDYKTLTADPRFHYEPRNQRRLQVIDA